MAKMYPGPWRTETNIDVVKTLVKNKVQGCGELAWRQAASGSKEFLVYCSRDGRTWTAYLAFTAVQNTMGPYQPDPALPLPPR